jgi:hypothetical protein
MEGKIKQNVWEKQITKPERVGNAGITVQPTRPGLSCPSVGNEGMLRISACLPGL